MDANRQSAQQTDVAVILTRLCVVVLNVSFKFSLFYLVVRNEKEYNDQ